MLLTFANDVDEDTSNFDEDGGEMQRNSNWIPAFRLSRQAFLPAAAPDMSFGSLLRQRGL